MIGDPATASKPLQGRRIVVTRSRDQAGILSAGLRALGAEVIELPTIEIVPPDTYEPLDAALRSLSTYQWLIVTSANTVRLIGERLTYLGLSPATLRSVKIAAVGSATAEALASLGAPPDLVPKEYVAESLVEALRDRVAGARILLARASVARDVIPEELAKLGATLDVVDAYRTAIPSTSRDAIRSLFAQNQNCAPACERADSIRFDASLASDGFPEISSLPDAITFTSSSTVKHFFTLIGEAGVDLPQAVAAISIGPITSATLREHGREPAAEAVVHDVEGLIEATLRACNPHRS